MTSHSLARVLVPAIVAALLAGCTFMYQRKYIVEPAEQLSASDRRAVFESFRAYLIDKGLRPLPPEASDDDNVVTFKVGGGSSGMLVRSPYSDLLELRYVSGGEFQLRLLRIVSHPVDFSEQGLAKFVEESESFIQEASAKKVRLRLAAR
jgi:hypothetical protein